jgi:hypothetical protein
MVPALLNIVSDCEQLLSAMTGARTGAEWTRIDAEPQSHILQNHQREEDRIESTHKCIKRVVRRDCWLLKVMKFGVDLANLDSLVVRTG